LFGPIMSPRAVGVKVAVHKYTCHTTWVIDLMFWQNKWHSNIENHFLNSLVYSHDFLGPTLTLRVRILHPSLAVARQRKATPHTITSPHCALVQHKSQYHCPIHPCLPSPQQAGLLDRKLSAKPNYCLQVLLNQLKHLSTHTLLWISLIARSHLRMVGKIKGQTGHCFQLKYQCKLEGTCSGMIYPICHSQPGPTRSDSIGAESLTRGHQKVSYEAYGNVFHTLMPQSFADPVLVQTH
jgi:hypothetical protein